MKWRKIIMSKRPNTKNNKKYEKEFITSLIDINNCSAIEIKLLNTDYSKTEYKRLIGSLTIGSISINVDFVYNPKKDEYFISLPSYKAKDGDYRNLVFIWDSDLLKELTKTVNQMIDTFLNEE